MIKPCFFRSNLSSLKTCLLGLIIFWVSPLPLLAADQVVTNNNDSGAGSLRQALIEVGSGENITFNLSTGNETIVIQSSFPLVEIKGFTLDGDNTSGSGTDVTIAVTIPSLSTYRIFEFEPSDTTITLKNLILKGGDVGSDVGGVIKVDSGGDNGNLILNNCIISDGIADFGGGIYVWGSINDLSIIGCTFQNCQSLGDTFGGGALFARELEGNLTIQDSTFRNNFGPDGGAIYIFQETFSMENCTITNNFSENNGGGIYSSGDKNLANSRIFDCTFNNNTAEESGGGICLYYGNYEITNCTIAQNSGIGGGILFSYATLYLTNSTIARNDHEGDIDGIYKGKSSTLFIKNSIVAQNGTGYDFYTDSGTDKLNDYGFNIVGNSYDGVGGYLFTGNGDWTDQDQDGIFSRNSVGPTPTPIPKEATFFQTDSPAITIKSLEPSGTLNLCCLICDNNTCNDTETLALLSGSIAIDGGDSSNNESISIPLKDQRDYSRLNGVDIGAYEYTGPSPSPTSPPLTPTPTSLLTTPSPSPNSAPTFQPTCSPPPVAQPPATTTIVTTTSTTTTTTAAAIIHYVIDFDDYTGDGVTDAAIFNDGVWEIQNVGTSNYGNPGDIPIAGDYDGDGIAEKGYFTNSGLWYVEGVYSGLSCGRGGQIPVPADYDGDGSTDPATYSPTTGTWEIYNQTTVHYGGRPGDIPVPGDYNGDGTAERAIYRWVTGELGKWYVDGGSTYSWGGDINDIPIPLDYDGDGATDPTFVRNMNDTYFLWKTIDGNIETWGVPSVDTPLTGDFNGDGAFEAVTWRAQRSRWLARNGGFVYRLTFGSSEGIPVIGQSY